MTNQEKLIGNYIRFEKGQQNPVEFLESIGGKLDFHLNGQGENVGYFIGDEGYIEACFMEIYPTITVNEAKALLNEPSEPEVGDWVECSDYENQEKDEWDSGYLLAILPETYSPRYIVSQGRNLREWSHYRLVCHPTRRVPTVPKVGEVVAAWHTGRDSNKPIGTLLAILPEEVEKRFIVCVPALKGVDWEAFEYIESLSL